MLAILSLVFFIRCDRDEAIKMSTLDPTAELIYQEEDFVEVIVNCWGGLASKYPLQFHEEIAKECESLGFCDVLADWNEFKRHLMVQFREVCCRTILDEEVSDLPGEAILV